MALVANLRIDDNMTLKKVPNNLKPRHLRTKAACKLIK